MHAKTDQNNSEFGHFSCSVGLNYIFVNNTFLLDVIHVMTHDVNPVRIKKTDTLMDLTCDKSKESVEEH